MAVVIYSLIVVVIGPGLTSCRREHPLFDLLTPNQTGISFANTITTTDSLNVLTDPYIYNGAGVAVGDIDNDGLPDIFFAGNMVSSRLYRNKGQMQFEDITDRAGVKTARWATGATMVDINNDGYLDIYVSVSGPAWSKAAERANLLFVNNRNGTFTEQAAKYGIADTNFTTQSVFLDYNGDGCLDLFVLNNSPTDFARNAAGNPSATRGKTPGSYNQLYRNNCNGTFANVSKEAGILEDAGYGLGVVVADFNGDGWPDIYVSNDILPNDVIYVNNGNGTFTNKAARWLKHSSYAGMGVDVADFNNDGLPDILQVDMLPHDMNRRKRVTGFLTYTGLLATRSQGIRDDYSVNSLQLNNGLTNGGDVVFSEISRMSRVSNTDWSWSALFADFDNDGYKDIFITNGYPKAVTDLDYQNAMFATRGKADAAHRRSEILRQLPGFEGSNFIFRNNGDLTFADMSKAWGTARNGYSYGAAYADLDNDGRLDLVVNNIDGPAFLYHNVTPSDDAHHWLRVKLDGDSSNPRGIGATLTLWTGSQQQSVYATPFRGYMSTVDERPHFGLGRHTSADSLVIIWPDRRSQTLTNVSADREIAVKHSAAAPRAKPKAAPPTDRVFQPLDALHAPAYVQRVGSIVDYTVQPLLPYMLSRHGPPIAVGDVNGDGLDDVYVGGSSGLPGKLFIQRKDGSFAESADGQPWEADKDFEDWGAVFFDANGDGLPDLYVTSGGYQLAPESPLLQDRLYINQGNGRFRRDTAALPEMLTSKGVVRVGDFNGDGKPDLFVGGRLTPRSYPSPTRSYVLRNDGGHFTDVTPQMAPELVKPGGMVTDAAWADLDGDGKLDLVTVGEWMPIQFFHNEGQRLRDVTSTTNLPPLRGWWYSLAVGDFDHDGRPDLIAGNLGLNYSYTTSAASPFGVYAGDLTGNRARDIVFTQTIGGAEYPYYGLVPLGKPIYTLTIRFPTYGAFAGATVQQAFGDAPLRQTLHYQADTFASMYLHNDGGLRFSATPLPMLAQIAPIRAIVLTDVDHDNKLDAIVAGNMVDVEPNTPPADAGNGLWLRGNGAGRFVPVSPRVSGLLASGHATGLALVQTSTGVSLLVANAGDSLRVFAISKR